MKARLVLSLNKELVLRLKRRAVSLDMTMSGYLTRASNHFEKHLTPKKRKEIINQGRFYRVTVKQLIIQQKKLKRELYKIEKLMDEVR